MSSRYRKTNCRLFISSQSSTKTANVAKIGRVDLEIFGLTDIVKKAHTHPFNGPLSGTTRVGRYQKGKTSLFFV